jgi:ribosome maturation factor RimP
MATAELKRLIEEISSKYGVHLIDLVVKGEGKDRLLEVYVDSEQGITTAICSDISREIHRLLETSDAIHGSYRLTVSSPGIARSLKHAWQYKKHVGRRLDVKVRLQEGIRSSTGTLTSVNDKALVLATGKKDEPESIPLDEIVEAFVLAPW